MKKSLPKISKKDTPLFLGISTNMYVDLLAYHSAAQILERELNDVILRPYLFLVSHAVETGIKIGISELIYTLQETKPVALEDLHQLVSPVLMRIGHDLEAGLKELECTLDKFYIKYEIDRVDKEENMFIEKKRWKKWLNDFEDTKSLVKYLLNFPQPALSFRYALNKYGETYYDDKDILNEGEFKEIYNKGIKALLTLPSILTDELNRYNYAYWD